MTCSPALAPSRFVVRLETRKQALKALKDCTLSYGSLHLRGQGALLQGTLGVTEAV